MKTLTAFVLATMMMAPALRAEDVVKGQREVLGFVGGVTDGGGATFGGGLQLGIKPRWLFAGELGWVNAGRNNTVISVDANVHYLFPLRNNPKITPYVLGGLGFLDDHIGLNLGGGIRWAVGTDWGIRPEIKVNIQDNTSSRLSVGFYKRF